MKMKFRMPQKNVRLQIISAAVVLLCLSISAYGERIADIEYARIGILDMTLDLYLPETPAKDLPLVVWIHGGGFIQGSKDKCRINWFLDHGYATASISYRLSNIATFPAQIHDCKGAIRWLRANAGTYGIDPDKIAVIGHSAGAALATLLGTSSGDEYLEGTVGGNLGVSSSVGAVICVSGTVDYMLRSEMQPKINNPDSMLARYLGGRPDKMVEHAKRASSIAYVTPDDPPMMIMHGSKETPSHFAQAKLLHDVYEEKGLDSVYVVAEGAAHNDLDLMFSEENRKLALALFDRAFASGVAKTSGKTAVTATPSPAKYSTEPLPVPNRFKDIAPERIRQYIPRRHVRKKVPFITAPDAKLGYAAPVVKPDMPFNFGYFQNDSTIQDLSALPQLPEGSKAAWKRTGKGFSLQRTLTAEEIIPGKYHIYELGEIRVTPDCLIWFSAQSWQTHLRVGTRLYKPDSDNRWQAYVSMKFDGPSYGGEAQEDAVLVDRVILVKE